MPMPRMMALMACSVSRAAACMLAMGVPPVRMPRMVPVQRVAVMLARALSVFRVLRALMPGMLAL